MTSKEMQPYFAATTLISLIISSFILLQGIGLAILTVLYFTGLIPADNFHFADTLVASLLASLFLILFSLPGIFAFAKRKKKPDNIFLKIQGWLLFLFFPLYIFMLPLPGPQFILFLMVGSFGLFIQAVISYDRKWKKEMEASVQNAETISEN